MMLFLGRTLLAGLTIKILGVVWLFAAMLAILFAGRDGMAGTRATRRRTGAGGVFGSQWFRRKLEAAFGGTGRLLLVLVFGALVCTDAGHRVDVFAS